MEDSLWTAREELHRVMVPHLERTPPQASVTFGVFLGERDCRIPGRDQTWKTLAWTRCHFRRNQRRSVWIFLFTSCWCRNSPVNVLKGRMWGQVRVWPGDGQVQVQRLASEGHRCSVACTSPPIFLYNFFRYLKTVQSSTRWPPLVVLHTEWRMILEKNHKCETWESSRLSYIWILNFLNA